MRNNCCGLQQTLGQTEFYAVQRGDDGQYTTLPVPAVQFKWVKHLFTMQLPADLKPQAEEV